MNRLICTMLRAIMQAPLLHGLIAPAPVGEQSKLCLCCSGAAAGVRHMLCAASGHFDISRHSGAGFLTLTGILRGS